MDKPWQDSAKTSINSRSKVWSKDVNKRFSSLLISVNVGNLNSVIVIKSLNSLGTLTSVAVIIKVLG